MPKFLMSVVWEARGIIEVEADNVDDAIDKVETQQIKPEDPENLDFKSPLVESGRHKLIE